LRTATVVGLPRRNTDPRRDACGLAVDDWPGHVGRSAHVGTVATDGCRRILGGSNPTLFASAPSSDKRIETHRSSDCRMAKSPPYLTQQVCGRPTNWRCGGPDRTVGFCVGDPNNRGPDPVSGRRLRDRSSHGYDSLARLRLTATARFRLLYSVSGTGGRLFTVMSCAPLSRPGDSLVVHLCVHASDSEGLAADPLDASTES